MKKLLIFIILFFHAYLYSAQVSLKIFDDSRISFALVSGSQVNLGNFLANNSFVYPDRVAILKNTGQIPISFALALRVTSSGLKAVKTVPEQNQFRLSGIFHEWNVVPSASKFESDDIIFTSYNYASSNTFAYLNDSADVKGADVAEGREVSLYVRLDSPSQITISPVILKVDLLIKAFIIDVQEEPHKKPDKKIFTPNGDGINDTLVFYGLGEKIIDSSFNIKIYSIRGRLVRAIKGLEFWDGKDDDGQDVPGGTYIYQYEYNNKFITGVVVIAR